MSPEILNEEGHEESSDWWSLGIVLYELASGNPPFMSRNIETIADDIRFEDVQMKDFFSQELKSLIDELTVKDPKKRIGNPLRGGINEVKRHPFFKGIDWNEVLNKQLQPPIVPEKKKGVVDLVSGDANPYKLLEQNFDKKTVLDAVYLYDSYLRDDGEGKTGADSQCLKISILSDVTGFTFDEDMGNNTRTSESKDSLEKKL